MKGSSPMLRGLLAGVFLALSACALHDVQHDDPQVPEKRPPPEQPAPAPEPEQYTVRSGDTLYGIAWEQGLDYVELARWNNIRAPYTIYPGQTIYLKPGLAPTPAARAAAPRETPPPSRPVAVKQTPSPEPATESLPSPGRYQTENQTQPAAEPAETAPARQPVEVVEKAPDPQPPAAPPPRPTTPTGEPVWRWPTAGTVASTFASGDSSRQGIDIRGREGQEVLAAAAGEVVYSGNGLLGYGELIIIKHDENWLSAYGNNRRRKVNEGVSVSAGQTIAEMGKSNGDGAELHFEIRRKGKPVDPLRYLPRR